MKDRVRSERGVYQGFMGSKKEAYKLAKRGPRNSDRVFKVDRRCG